MTWVAVWPPMPGIFGIVRHATFATHATFCRTSTQVRAGGLVTTTAARLPVPHRPRSRCSGGGTAPQLEAVAELVPQPRLLALVQAAAQRPEARQPGQGDEDRGRQTEGVEEAAV